MRYVIFFMPGGEVCSLILELPGPLFDVRLYQVFDFVFRWRAFVVCVTACAISLGS